MSEKLSRAQLTLLLMALMATGIGQSMVFAILAPLGRQIQLTELQITSIIAASALTFGVAAPFWGRLSDRVGRKPIMLVGLAGYTIGMLVFTSVLYAGLTGVLSGMLLYVMLMASRCSQAAVMSATNPASSAYAADHTTRTQRTRTMARLGTANSLGTILGPAVSGALAIFGLLAPLYFAVALAGIAGLIIWWRLPLTPATQLTDRPLSAQLRYTDPRIALLLGAAIGLFIGFSGIQQTLGFQLQDKLNLTGVETAQLTGAALMISAVFTLLMQLTVMQRAQLRPTQFVRMGLLALVAGALIVAVFNTFLELAIGMAFLGAGMALCMPAIAAGASLAVTPKEQGAAAGLVSSCPPLGFAIGPICAGALYQMDAAFAPIFSAVTFLVVLLVIQHYDR